MDKLIVFALVAAIPAMAAAAEPQAKRTSDPDKVICKTFAETGSLVNTKRECKTRRDWDREREDLRANAGANANSCRNSGSTGC